MFFLTKDSVPCSTIILGNHATWLDHHAAEELQNYIRKISGATLIITNESYAASVAGNKILIGLSSGSEMIRKFHEKNPGMLPEESSVENDCVAYTVRGDTLVLSGSNSRSVYYSVCHLLQTEFGVGFYWDRDVFEEKSSLGLPDDLNFMERSAFQMRHTVGQWVYNHGAFLNAQERREELDKYARNKINSYRLYNWNSYARKKTFLELGMTGITITEEDIARRDCVRDTIAYAQKLGMEVMVFLIPDELTLEFRDLYKEARYFGCEWVKDDDAEPNPVPCLYPDDPMFKTLIQTFVKVWIEIYGPTSNFVCSPPAEHHISTGVEDFIEININYPKYTYEALHELIPNARLFYDGWAVRANTPPGIWTMPGVMQRFVDQMPEEVYFLDLWPNWKEKNCNFREPMYRDENYGPLRKVPYILEPLNEFGGQDYMHGDFARHIEAAREMTDPAMVDHGAGFGNCTELCGVSLHFFDLIFQLAWKPDKITLESFLRDSARRRYGGLPEETGWKAMRILEQAVYGDRDSSHARYQKRLFLARPQRTLASIRETQEIVELLGSYMKIMTALPDDRKTDAIGQDMYDVMRQYITENFNLYLESMLELFLHRGAAENLHMYFEMYASILEQLMTQLEVMTRENTSMYVETIVRRFQGRPCDPDVSSADCPAPADFRAWMRDLGTTFAKSIPNLLDYDSQDYHELICCYYHPRVSACIETLRTLLDDHGKTEARAVDDMLEQKYKVIEDHWIVTGYPVSDDCEEVHLPLWQAAQRAWEALGILTLKEGLFVTGNREKKETVDVFASFPENSERKEERSWVSENPFAPCE